MTPDVSAVSGKLVGNAYMRSEQFATVMAAGAVNDQPCTVKRKCYALINPQHPISKKFKNPSDL